MTWKMGRYPKTRGYGAEPGHDRERIAPAHPRANTQLQGIISLTHGRNYAFCPPMPAALQTADPGASPGPQDQTGNKGGHLLGLVRKIIAYGRDLVASLQQQNAPTPSPQIVRRFASVNLAVIIARITRGLAMAGLLDARLVNAEFRPDKLPPTGPREATTLRPEPRPRRPKLTRPDTAEDDAALRAALPSIEEIAERVRNRPVGAVIADICRDLGINGMDDLWRDLQLAITYNGGNFPTMSMEILRRIQRAGPSFSDWTPPRRRSPTDPP